MPGLKNNYEELMNTISVTLSVYIIVYKTPTNHEYSDYSLLKLIFEWLVLMQVANDLLDIHKLTK